MRQHLFVFPDEPRAVRFVQQLVHHLRDIAVYRQGASVYLIDAEENRMHRILELARESESQLSIPLPRRDTL